jgi:hypothetical protein
LRDAYAAFCSFGGGDGEHINTKIFAKLAGDVGGCTAVESSCPIAACNHLVW